MSESSREEAESERDFVESLARGLLVLRAFGREAPEMTLSEVAAKTGLTRAAARRFLLTLRRLGYVYSEGKRFGLTPRVLELGFSYLSSLPLWDVAMPYMEQVSAKVGESCSASVLDGGEIVYVARVPTRQRIMSVALNLGARLPAFATSMGRVLLACLPEAELEQRLAAASLVAHTPHTMTDKAELWRLLGQVREQGYCLVDQELEMGLRSVAVPLRDARGRVLAALNISAHASRTSCEELQRGHLPILLEAAKDIARALP